MNQFGRLYFCVFSVRSAVENGEQRNYILYSRFLSGFSDELRDGRSGFDPLPCKIFLMAVQYFKQLVAGFPPRRPGFEPGSSHVIFVADKVALGQVFSEYFGFPCQSSFHKLLHHYNHQGLAQ
jgi:hypothetical protein